MPGILLDPDELPLPVGSLADPDALPLEPVAPDVPLEPEVGTQVTPDAVDPDELVPDAPATSDEVLAIVPGGQSIVLEPLAPVAPDVPLDPDISLEPDVPLDPEVLPPIVPGSELLLVPEEPLAPLDSYALPDPEEPDPMLDPLEDDCATAIPAALNRATKSIEDNFFISTPLNINT